MTKAIPPGEITSSEYNVILETIRLRRERGANDGELIQDRTITPANIPGTCLEDGEKKLPLFAEVMKGAPGTIHAERLPGLSVLNAQQREDVARQGRELHKQPATIMLFSRVAFLPDKSEALVYLQLACGKLCGGGQFYRLKRAGDSWRFVKSYCTWAS